MALDASSARFIEGVSAQTGIDPRVLVAWLENEGANAKNGTGGYNYLNLRPFPGDPYVSVSSGDFEQFSNVSDAVAATVRRLEQPFARPIIAAARGHATPQQEIGAIATTGWDSTNYGGFGVGPNLLKTFAGIFGGEAGLTSTYQGPGTAAEVAATAGTGSAADAGSFDANNAADAAKNAINGALGGLAGIFGGIWSWIQSRLERLGLLLAGALLVILGVLLVARGEGISTPVPAVGG